MIDEKAETRLNSQERAYVIERRKNSLELVSNRRIIVKIPQRALATLVFEHREQSWRAYKGLSV